jgi:hypothetical protein
MLKKHLEKKAAALKSRTITLDGSELKFTIRLRSRKNRVDDVQKAFEKTRYGNEVFSIKRG